VGLKALADELAPLLGGAPGLVRGEM
jgi:hypothetical protein